jgi:hypothetical protein
VATYKIIRFFFKGENETIETGLTLEEAQEHCNDPETSSRTCSEKTRERVGAGPWFDGYNEE